MRVASNPHHGWVSWKPFQMHFEMRKGILHIVVFCIFARIEFEFMSNFVRLVLGTSWTNMEAQDYLVLQFHLDFDLERENGPN